MGPTLTQTFGISEQNPSCLSCSGIHASCTGTHCSINSTCLCLTTSRHASFHAFPVCHTPLPCASSVLFIHELLSWFNKLWSRSSARIWVWRCRYQVKVNSMCAYMHVYGDQSSTRVSFHPLSVHPHHQIWLFTWHPGIKSRSSRLYRKLFTKQAVSPAPARAPFRLLFLFSPLTGTTPLNSSCVNAYV